MEHIRNFLRGKGFALALLACVAAAAAVGVWAVRTVRDLMAEDLGQSSSQSLHRRGDVPRHRCRHQPGHGGSDMGTGIRQRGPVGGRCARTQLVWRILWCVVWLWFGFRTFRAANRIAHCQRLSRLGLYAACLWTGARRLERGRAGLQ